MGLWMGCASRSQVVVPPGPVVAGAGPAATAAGTPSPGMSVETEDRNRDGKPDKWTECAIAGGLKRCEKLDLDFDGKVDVVRQYDERGAIASEKRDLDYDGRIDDERIFNAGVLTEERSGFGFDGKFHHRVFYENGKKTREEIDLDQDGRVDEWRYFDDDGRLVRVGMDTDHDGQPDQFKRATATGDGM